MGKINGVVETHYGKGKLWTRETYKDGVVEQESIRNVIEEKLLRLCRENLAMEIMLLRDKQVAGEITLKQLLKQSVGLVEEYDKKTK